MTWGQLRFQLQTSAPGVSLDLLDEWINGRYQTILDHYDWKGIEVEAVLQTVAVQTAAVSATQGATLLAGTGTSWSASIVGFKLTLDSQIVYTVRAVSSSTQLTLDRPFEGVTVSGAAAQIFQNEYVLPPNCKRVTDVQNPYAPGDMVEWSAAKMDAAIVGLVQFDEPAFYSTASESAAPVLNRMAIWPVPMTVHGLPYRYELAATAFDGTNTSDGPLPFVQDQAILSGVRADIAAHLEKTAMVQVYEAKFMAALVEMVRLDAKRQGPTSLQMASRYTGHRIERVLRGYTRRLPD